jgi:hypothetical protein
MLLQAPPSISRFHRRLYPFECCAANRLSVANRFDSVLVESCSPHEFADAQIRDFHSQIRISGNLAGGKVLDWQERQQAWVLALRPAPIGFFADIAQMASSDR